MPSSSPICRWPVKTGTTSATRDVWFAGFTPYYTCAVWPDMIPTNFWKMIARISTKLCGTNVMSRIHQELPSADFEVPSNVKQATICAESGLLAGMGCSTRTEYFDVSTIPTARCTHYVPPTPEPTPVPTVTPTPHSGGRYGSQCSRHRNTGGNTYAGCRFGGQRHADNTSRGELWRRNHHAGSSDSGAPLRRLTPGQPIPGLWYSNKQWKPASRTSIVMNTKTASAL